MNSGGKRLAGPGTQMPVVADNGFMESPFAGISLQTFHYLLDRNDPAISPAVGY
jgi:hypothetical protein